MEKSDFYTNLTEKYSYKNYSHHFEGVYRFVSFFCLLLLGASALFSSKFFESYFVGVFDEYAIYAGFVCSALLAAGISIIYDKFLVYWHYHRSFEPVLGIALIILISGNFYADFKGAPSWAEKIVGESPTDERTGNISGIYSPQIEAINSEIEAIESLNFYWCGTHKAHHKCKSASFYIHPKHDKKAVSQIEALKAQKAELLNSMNTMLNDANKNFQSSLNGYNDKLNGNRGRMKFGSVACTLLYMILSVWMLKYGIRSVKTATVQDETVTANRKTVSDEAKAAWDKLVNDNPELAEEIQARHESEKK